MVSFFHVNAGLYTLSVLLNRMGLDYLRSPANSVMYDWAICNVSYLES